jgi:2-haloacid dehalogenase
MADNPLPEACVFDAYGTLFDYASSVAQFRETLGNKWEPLTALWREKQLQYTWLRTLQNNYVDFWQVTSDALAFALETLGVQAATLHAELMNAYRTLDAFPEVPEVLEQLKRNGIRTAILSNGSPDMLHSAVSHAGIAGLLDWVLSVDEVGVYKPHPKVYQLALDRLGMGRQAVSYQSSNAWDAWAASAFGMRVVWCNRYAQSRERLPGLPDQEVSSLRNLPFLRR